MSAFASWFAASGMTKLLDQLGQTITYTPVGGSPVTRQAIFNEFVGAFDEKGNAIFTIASDSTTGIASPGRGDKITLGSDIWEVWDVRADQAGGFELRCGVPILVT